MAVIQTPIVFYSCIVFCIADVSQKMEKEEGILRLSDWVHTCHNMNKITGFVIGFADDQILINVTIPKDYGVIAVNQKDVLPADDTIWLDDIPSLIDLALMIRDREWFQKWVRELSMWMSVEELNHQG